MFIFFLCLFLLFLGYRFYIPFAEKQVNIDPKAQTPQQRLAEGVDYVPVHPLKAYLIQFLNVAGVGPIFGPIMGAMYGPVALVWIVLGNILGGSIHDFFSGVLSIKEDGKSVPEIAGRYFNTFAKFLMLIFTAMLLFFVGVVFIMSPAGLLGNLSFFDDTYFDEHSTWVFIILGYYLVATILPINKIITKVYPFFGFLMFIMTILIGISLLFNAPHLPVAGDFFSYFKHDHADLLTPNPDGAPIWPLLFMTITCGAISGFHSTQAPIMARCLTNEKYVRPVYAGAMISEGVVACVWALAGIAAFPGGYPELKALLGQGGPSVVVNHVATSYLGFFGGVIAVIAVAIFPITSGDTAFRSLRLTITDAFDIKQSTINRLLIGVPILTIAYFITLIDFSLVWRYFSFANMLLATSVLWLATRYLFLNKTFHWITSLPAIIGTSVTLSYILSANIGVHLSISVAKSVSLIIAVILLIGIIVAHKKTYK